MFGAGIVCAQPAGLGDVYFSNDADGFSSQRLGAGATLRHGDPYDYSGVLAQHIRYAQDGWSASGQRLSLLHRAQVASTGEGVVAELGAASMSGRTRVLGEATYNRRFGAGTAIEFIAARDWVDTRPAIEAGLTSTFAGASVEQALTSRLTAIALAGWQHFSDGNDRRHLRGRLIFGLLPAQGVTLQLRHRRYAADDLGVPRRYFNPEHYEETQLALAMRRRVPTPAGGWVVLASAAAGQERVDRDARHSTALFELRAEGPLASSTYLRLAASHQRASGYEAGPDYWFTQLGISLIVALR